MDLIVKEKEIAKSIALVVLLLAVSAIAVSMIPEDSDADVVASGSCGIDVTYSLDGGGIMTILGGSNVAAMENYSQTDSPPWYDIRDQIKKAVFAGTFHERNVGWKNCVGSYAFADCVNLEEVDFSDAENLDVIGEHAFDGCVSLRTVTMSNDIQNIKAGAFNECPIEEMYVSDNGTLQTHWKGMNPNDVREMSGHEVIFDENGYTVVDSDINFIIHFSVNPEDGGEHIPPVVIEANTTATITDNIITLTNVKNGSTISAKTIEAKANGGFEFYKWNNVSDGQTITETTTIEALFEEIPEYCTVTWMSQDGTAALETDENVPYGSAPSYDSEEPTKPSDAQYNYSFAGWAAEADQEAGVPVSQLENVTRDIAYYAAFSKTLRFFVYENVLYLVLEDRGTVSAFGYDGEPESIAIPDVVYGDGIEFVPVSIAEGAFADCATVTSAEIGSTVADIGLGAFDSPYLGSIEVSPDNGAYSSEEGVLFDKGQSVLLRFPAAKQKMVIPDVTEIAPGAYKNVGAALKQDYAGGDITYFRYAKIPSTVVSIGDDAFRGSTLECLKFSGGEVSIGDYVFAGCYALNYIVFNAVFDEIGTDIFEGCTFYDENDDPMDLDAAMAGHKFTSTVPCHLDLYIPGVGGIIIDGDVKYRITANEGSKTVAAAGFAADAVSDLVIPESISYLGFEWAVSEIAFKAFYGCQTLESVTLEGAPAIVSYAFSSCKALETVDLGGASVLGTSAFSGCVSLSAISLENVVEVGKHAFFSCKALASADLSAAETIGYGAFTGTSLQDVSFGDALAEVDSKAFYGYTFQDAAGTKIKADAGNLRGNTFSGQGKVLVMEA